MQILTINKKEYSKAFTIIEIAVVLIISGLVYMTVSPAVLKMVETAKMTSTEDIIKDISLDIDKFFEDNGRYPDSLEEVFGEVPLDPWGNPYRYANLSDVKNSGIIRKDKNLVPINSDYDLYSMGPDGESVPPLTAAASQDDIVRGRNGDYIGLATEF